MGRRLWAVGFLVWALFGLSASAAQTHSGIPVDVTPGPSPQPVDANGRAWILYELHVTNYVNLPLQITSFEVLGRGNEVLAGFKGDSLKKILAPVEALSTAGGLPTGSANAEIGEGHAALLFVDMALDKDVVLPRELRHRFSVSVTLKNGKTVENTFEGIPVPLVREPCLVLRAPLRGGRWVAFNSLGGVDHRRALNAVDGRERIPQRFAIDWTLLGPDGKFFHDVANRNTNYYGYGAEVLAVADARVSDIKDGLPENDGASARSDRKITLDNVFGNYIILDLGGGRFAAYAHLQPGSIRVKVGDRVKVGQVLARLGNSGNSDAPHLHFQVVDANAPLASEGLPFELDRFTQTGLAPEGLGSTITQWQPGPHDGPVVHRRELPLRNAVVELP